MDFFRFNQICINYLKGNIDIAEGDVIFMNDYTKENNIDSNRPIGDICKDHVLNIFGKLIVNNEVPFEIKVRAYEMLFSENFKYQMHNIIKENILNNIELFRNEEKTKLISEYIGNDYCLNKSESNFSIFPIIDETLSGRYIKIYNDKLSDMDEDGSNIMVVEGFDKFIYGLVQEKFNDKNFENVVYISPLIYNELGMNIKIPYNLSLRNCIIDNATSITLKLLYKSDNDTNIDNDDIINLISDTFLSLGIIKVGDMIEIDLNTVKLNYRVEKINPSDMDKNIPVAVINSESKKLDITIIIIKETKEELKDNLKIHLENEYNNQLDSIIYDEEFNKLF